MTLTRDIYWAICGTSDHYDPNDLLAPFISYNETWFSSRANEIVDIERYFADQAKTLDEYPHMKFLPEYKLRRKNWVDIEAAIKYSSENYKIRKGMYPL